MVHGVLTLLGVGALVLAFGGTILLPVLGSMGMLLLLRSQPCLIALGTETPSSFVWTLSLQWGALMWGAIQTLALYLLMDVGHQYVPNLTVSMFGRFIFPMAGIGLLWFALMIQPSIGVALALMLVQAYYAAMNLSQFTTQPGHKLSVVHRSLLALVCWRGAIVVVCAAELVGHLRRERSVLEVLTAQQRTELQELAEVVVADDAVCDGQDQPLVTPRSRILQTGDASKPPS